MCKGRKYLCKIQKLGMKIQKLLKLWFILCEISAGLGEKLVVGEEISDDADPGPFCEENGVEKVLKCALVRDEKNREK